MGGRQSKHSSLLDDKEWTVIHADQSQLFANVNSFASRTLRNTRTNQQIEQYKLQFASQSDYLQYARQLRMRKQLSKGQIYGQDMQEGYHHLSPYIYTIRYFVNDSMEDMCSTVYKGLLYAKKVDLRLKEINDIPFPDQLYLTKTCLQGFKVLYEKMGFFDICEEMVFISNLGEVKVWINPNISKNQPYYYPSSGREPHGSQADMIVKLLDIIEENTDQFNNDTIHFREYLVNKGIFDRLSFYKALEQFQLYLMEERLQTDDYMKSIYELYHPELEDRSQLVKETRRDFLGFGNISPPEARVSEKVPQDTPVRKQSFGSAAEKVSKMVPLPASSALYNSQAIKRSSELVRPNFQSVDKNRPFAPPPSFRQPSNTPQFATPNQSTYIHIRRDSNEAKIAPLPGFPQRKMQTSLNGNIGDNSERKNVILSIDRCVPDKRQNNFVKFNYGGIGAPSIQIPPPQIIQKPQPVSTISVPTNSGLHIPFGSARVPVQPPPFSRPQYRHLTANLATAKTINTDSNPTTRDLRTSSNATKVSYYSANEVYNLDSEIAEDLNLFLGYNPKS